MAVLDAANRLATAAQLMRGALGAVSNVTKLDVRAAVNATDQWIEDNSASFSTALPAAFRTNASLGQKTLLFCYVAMRRANLLRTEEDG